MAGHGRDLARGRMLTPEEAAHYRTIRQQVVKEIPPATTNVVCDVIGKLRRRREEQGLSLADVEAQTEMTRANLCRLEKAARNVQLRSIERYARALGCRVDIQLVPVVATARPPSTGALGS